MKIEKTLEENGSTFVVLVDDYMRIIPEVLLFTNFLVESKGVSPNTVEGGYVRDLKIFFEWLEHENKQFWEVKAADMPDFIRFADNQGKGKKSPATMNRILATLSSFYRHFEAIGGYISEVPVVKVQGVRNPEAGKSFLHHTINRRVVDVHYFKRKVRKRVDKKRLYPHQAEKLYDSIDCDEKSTDTEISTIFRNKLVFKILYETGMRIGELLHLRVMDYNTPSPHKSSGNIYLVERYESDLDRQLKTGERTIPVAMDLLYELDRYVTEFRPYKPGVEYIFVSHKGRSKGQPLSRRSLEEWFRVVSKRCGIKCTPHALRHTHASNLADAGYDSIFIKARLGHANINTSAKYMLPSLKVQIASYEAYLANKPGGNLQ